MRPTRALTITAALAILPAFFPGPALARTIALADIDGIVDVGDPQIAPDGRSILVVVARPNPQENRSDAELVLVDIATGGQRVLTHDRPDVTHPRWSPAGDRIAFLAKAPMSQRPSEEKTKCPGAAGEDRYQVFVLPMNGGEARRLTAAPEGVQAFSWSPDGRSLAYTTADGAPDREAMKKGNDAFEVGDNDMFASEAPTPTHIWLVTAEGGEAKRLTSGTWGLPESAPPGPPAAPLSWSPDGRRIAFTRQTLPHYGDSDQSTVQILDVASGAIWPLTGRKELEGFPVFSPDGTQIAYWYPRDGDLNNVMEINVAPAPAGAAGAAGSAGPGREPVPVTRALDRCLYRQIWMPDGKALLVGGNDLTRTSLWIQPIGGSARRLDLGAVSPSTLFWVEAAVGRDGAIAFPGSETKRPTELYYLPAGASAPKRLTDFNAAIAALDLGRSERITWKGPGGFLEDGVLLYPPDFSPGRKYPLVLDIHGGPQWSSREVFDELDQLMAARGWVVFMPNYRGSDNLGNAYMRAIMNDAGAGPGSDVMAGLAEVKKRGFVDEARIAVTGWSYGGYMTTWMIGNDQGWKAAIAGAAVTDWIDTYALADFNVMARWAFGGSPFTGDRDKAYRAQSPITYAGKIRTPTLILSDTLDARVPITQSYKLYHALKDNGVPVSFVAFPTAGHFPGDPGRKRDLYHRWLEWLERYLAPAPAR